jgi:hypothetical protein
MTALALRVVQPEDRLARLVETTLKEVDWPISSHHGSVEQLVIPKVRTFRDTIDSEKIFQDQLAEEDFLKILSALESVTADTKTEPTIAISELYTGGSICAIAIGLVSIAFLYLYDTPLLHPLISLSLLVISPFFWLMGREVRRYYG